MIHKFSEALHLLWKHLWLFMAIILTVWLPGNIVINYINYNVATASDTTTFKLAIWIEALFGPIYIGALIYALFQIKLGHTVTYNDAILVGIKKWVTLFAARFVAGIFITVGLIAFIIPGIVLIIRYSLLDAAVIIENKFTSEARTRSSDLTIGRRWQIFWAAIVFYPIFILLSVAIYLPLAFFDSLNTMPVEIALDCILDVVYSVLQIVMFLFYWESVKEEQNQEQNQDYERQDEQYQSNCGTADTDLDREYGKILGLTGKITKEAVEWRWRELCKQYHPDLVQHLGPKLREVAEQETKVINDAYQYFREKYNF